MTNQQQINSIMENLEYYRQRRDTTTDMEYRSFCVGVLNSMMSRLATLQKTLRN